MKSQAPLRERIMLSRWFWLGIVVVLIFVVYSLVRIAQRRYEINQVINEKRTIISGLRRENEKLDALLSYYASDYYREQVSRRELGLQRPGEEVIAVPGNIDKNGQNGTVSQEQIMLEGKDSNDITRMPSFVKWWKLFFATD